MFKSLIKATVGAVVEVPLSAAADVLTLAGALTEREEPYTVTACKKVMRNVEAATSEDDDA